MWPSPKERLMRRRLVLPSLLTLLALLSMSVSLNPAGIYVVRAATTWTVNSTADDASSDCATTALNCELRDALSQAQNGDIIQFSLTYPATIKPGSAGTLVVSTNVTINGPGASNLTIDGSGNGQKAILSVNSGVTTSINGVTIANANNQWSNGGGIQNNGNLTVSNTTFFGNSTGSMGGGISNSSGMLTVNSCNFSSELATSGGGISNSGTLTINNSSFTNNQTGHGFGGGIDNETGGVATVSDSTFDGNGAVLRGGAIINQARLTISGSTFSGNNAGQG